MTDLLGNPVVNAVKRRSLSDRHNQHFERFGSMQSPVVTLKSGVRVANFSSPHEFVFTDGSVLPGCDPERARVLMLENVELECFRERWYDITLLFSMSDVVRSSLKELEENTDVDLVLVPFPVMEALKQKKMPIGKCRVCRVADRVTKVIHSDRFCV